MNSNTVLSKIMTLLSLESKEEVKLAYAKLADGTILESPTFDVGEAVEVVSEDGTKSPAPDGEHELELTGAEGETVRFKIITEGGVIKERENVELEEQDGEKEEELEAETVEVQPLPNTTDEDPANKAAEFEKADEEELEEEVTEEEESEVTINLEDVAEKVEQMAYRIEELEKKLEAQEEIKEEIKEELEEEIKEEELEDKKLDGAPIEMKRAPKNLSKSTVKNYHNSVLSRMYKN